MGSPPTGGTRGVERERALPPVGAGTERGHLDEHNVVGYLARRGIVRTQLPEGVAKVTPLGGGVSNVVLLVEAGPQRLVVKQPRHRLLVEEEWFAGPERAMSEAAAIELARQMTPSAVPPLLDADPEACVIAMAAAPPTWGPWKELLLGGKVDPSVGLRLGRTLGAWHLASRRDQGSLAPLAGLDIFQQLRIDPYHRAVARRHPDLAGKIGLAIDTLLHHTGQSCLVHGDFSPKNVLLGGGGMWVIDFEVAHAGNPVFDLAFLLSHLLLKSLHRPTSADAYRQCAAQFLDGYQVATGRGFIEPGAGLALQVGCLVVARVDGKSPAEYLTGPERAAARHLGMQLIRDPVDAMSAWSLVEKATAP